VPPAVGPSNGVPPSRTSQPSHSFHPSSRPVPASHYAASPTTGSRGTATIQVFSHVPALSSKYLNICFYTRLSSLLHTFSAATISHILLFIHSKIFTSTLRQTCRLFHAVRTMLRASIDGATLQARAPFHKQSHVASTGLYPDGFRLESRISSKLRRGEDAKSGIIGDSLFKCVTHR
jgi:hypothetical protein